MSLLNQVLQDLDERAISAAVQQVRLATEAAPDPVHAAAVQAANEMPGPDWPRRVAWGSVFLAAVGTALLLYPSDRPLRHAIHVVQPPRLVVSAALELPAQLSAPNEPPGSPAEAAQRVPEAAKNPPETNAQSSAQTGRDTTAGKPASTLPERSIIKSGTDRAYIPLRNAVVPPPATRHPSAVSPGLGGSGKVKTDAPVAQQPLVVVRRAIAEGEIAMAEALLSQHVKNAPRDREARELLIGLMLRGDRQGAALQQLDLGLQQHPEHAKFALIKARLLVETGDAPGALQVLDGIRGTRTGRTELLQLRGALYQQLVRYEEAVANYRELLSLTPMAGTAWVGLAISLDGLGDAESIEAYRRALQIGGLPDAAANYARQRLADLGQHNG